MIVSLKNVLGETVLVNPDRVRWSRDNGKTVTIFFDKDHEIEVEGSVYTVLTVLNNGLMR